MATSRLAGATSAAGLVHNKKKATLRHRVDKAHCRSTGALLLRNASANV